MNPGKRSDQDFRAELESHIAHETERLIAEGMAPTEARAAARRRFGNRGAAQERFYESRRWLWWEHLGQDLRYAFRSMRKSPGFTLAAVATLALGIGVNTAIFSLVDGVLLRMLPVERPQELVFLYTAGTEGTSGSPPYPCFERFRNETRSFSGVALFAQDELKVQVEGKLEAVFGQVASGNYFEVLGLKPVLGRLMTKADEKLDPPVAVISHRYWQRRFGGDPAALGKTVGFGESMFTLVGITPPEFWGLRPGRPVDVTFPVNSSRALRDSDARWFDAFARLKPGVSLGQAKLESDAIYQTFMRDYGMRDYGNLEMRKRRFDHMELQPAAQGLHGLRRQFSKPLFVLMGLVVLVLLIACANISNLLLARGAARSREFAIRLATGAGRGRLLRQLLTETLVLFSLGAAAGMPLAFWAVQGLTGFFSVGRQPIVLDIHYDGRLIGFTLCVALATGVIFGLLPAIRALRTDPQTAMKEGETRVSESRDSGLVKRLLIVWQVALSMVLLVGAAAFLRTMANLSKVDLGFQPKRIVTMSIETLDAAVPPRARVAFWSQLIERVQGVPGVSSASISVLTPLSGRNRQSGVSVPGFQPKGESDRSIALNYVSDRYFETFGIDVIAGRRFTPRDADGTTNAVIINETAAKAYFANRDPIGQTLTLSIPSTPAYQVVGVVEDTKHNNIREKPPRFAMFPIRPDSTGSGRVTLSVASALPESQLASTITREVHAMNPGVLVSEVVSVKQQIDSVLLSERLVSMLASVFGSLALLLSAVGLYGVVSYSVTRRIPEIGIRIALGATPANIGWSVVRQTMLLVVTGIALGLVGAVFAVRAAKALLFGVGEADPVSYAVAAGVLAAVAVAATYAPALRAASLDPMQALRHD